MTPLRGVGEIRVGSNPTPRKGQTPDRFCYSQIIKNDQDPPAALKPAEPTNPAAIPLQPPWPPSSQVHAPAPLRPI